VFCYASSARFVYNVAKLLTYRAYTPFYG